MLAPINNIFYNTNIQLQNKNKNNYFIPKSQLLKYDSVSFGHKELLEQTPEEILQTLKNSVNPKNFIGSGAEAEVYKIEGTNYCLRLVNKDENKIPKQINFNLSEQDKINHVRAKLGTNGSSIMRYIEGSPVLDIYTNKENFKHVSEEIAQMPVTSFQKLLKQICYAYKNDMMFDCNWSNMIVNSKNKTLTAIDFYKMDEPEAMNPLCYSYASFVHEGTTLKQKQTYAGKLLLAALEEFRPEVTPYTNLTNFDFEGFIHTLFNTNVLENQNFRNIMIDTFSDIRSLKYQLIQHKECSNELTGKLKVAKSLIKQLLNVV